MTKINDLDKRITVLETQLEERWKETILRIKRIEQILFGSAGTIIVLLVGLELAEYNIFDYYLNLQY